MPLRVRSPYRGLLSALFVCALVLPAAAQGKKKQPPSPTPTPAPQVDPKAENNGGGDKSGGKEKGGKDKVKNFDFNALDLNGRMRTPQLLYFLERANEELERASLEKRSFIPHMVRSVEEEQL
jgi:hypothetical protein